MSTTAIDNTEIKYDRITKDYAVLVDGMAVAYGRTYSEAEAKRTAYLAERTPENTSACSGFGCVDGCGDCATTAAPSLYELILAECQAKLDGRMARSEPVVMVLDVEHAPVGWTA